MQHSTLFLMGINRCHVDRGSWMYLLLLSQHQWGGAIKGGRTCD